MVSEQRAPLSLATKLVATSTAVVLAVVGTFIVLKTVPPQPGDPAATSEPGAESDGSTAIPVPSATAKPTPTPSPGPTASTPPSDSGGGSDETDGNAAAPPGPDSPDPDSPVLPPGSTRSIYDEAGNLRMPMPQLARETTVVRNADGTATVTAGFGFDVANRESRPGVRQDRAIIHFMVHTQLSAGGGPLRTTTPLFSRVLIESALNESHVERDYAVKLPADVVAFLDTKGFASTDPMIRRAALVYIDIDVQHMRDFKSVDGEWDWQQGGAWTAADFPVQASTTRSSTITITNKTGDGIYRTHVREFPNYESIETDGAYAWGLIEAELPASGRVVAVASELIDETTRFAAPISLSGQAVQCIAQGNGSNPQGFALLNGWDIEDSLAPGTIPAGASVTQTVVADDSVGMPTEAILEQTGTAAVQVTASVLNYTTPGVKSGLQYAYMAALGLSTVTDEASMALGVPIKAIVELGMAIYDAATESCADFANIVNITAVEPSGAQSSVSWADEKAGLFSIYQSAVYDGVRVEGAVQLAKSTGLVTGVVDGTPYAANPYLSQFAQDACGSASDCANNEIEIQWSANSPCPQNNQADCLPQATDIASPEITVPGTSLCGVENELCPTVAAPISSGSDVPTQTDVAGTEGNPYAVLTEEHPAGPVTAMTVDDTGAVYLGYVDGNVQVTGPTQSPRDLAGFAGGVTTMATIDGLVYIGDGAGQVWVTDPATASRVPMIGYSGGEYPTHIAGTGGGTAYVTTNRNNLYFVPAYDPEHPIVGTGNLVVAANVWGEFDSNMAGESITSTASDGTVLFLGFESGHVMKCALTACEGTLELWVNPFSLPNVGTDGQNAGFAALALQIVGDQLYLGGSDASLWQIGVSTGSVKTIQTVGSRDAQIAGLALADGALYVGGCLGIENPINGDMLGVYTLTSIGTPSLWATPTGLNEAYTDSCIDPSSTTSNYKGFDPSTYQMVVSKPDPGLPAIVYVSFSIKSGNFLYALQNTALPTVDVCSAVCPPETQLSYYDTDATTTPTTPAAADLLALGAPDIRNSCGTTSGYGTTATGPLLTGGSTGVLVEDGFQLVAAGSPTADCTSQFAWKIGDVGTFPYAYWSGLAYPDSVSAAGGAPELTVSAGWDTGSVSEVVTDPDGEAWLAALRTFAPKYLPMTPGTLTDAYPFPLYDSISATPELVLSPPPVTPVAEAGTPLIVPLDGRGLLVITVVVPAGSDPIVIDIGDETLTPAGSNPPTPPLIAVCAPFDLSLAGPEALVYPLDDVIDIAADITGNGFNGLIAKPGAQNAAPGPAIGCPQSGALTFDFGSTGVDAGPQTDTLVDGESFTAMAWFKLPIAAVSGNPRLIASDHTDESGVGFQLALEGGDVTKGFFDVGTAAGIGTATWTSPTSLADGQWHQVVGAYDGTTVTAYLDGVAVGSGAITGTVLPGGWNVSLGHDPAYGSDYFAGQLADVMISASALSPEAIAAIYAQMTGP
jgi:hypothetical protein